MWAPPTNTSYCLPSLWLSDANVITVQSSSASRRVASRSGCDNVGSVFCWMRPLVGRPHSAGTAPSTRDDFRCDADRDATSPQP